MNTNPKRSAALTLLGATGMWRSNYEPPLLRLLWRFGVDAPPPHFVGFSEIAIVAGAVFAVGYGLAMWLIEGSRDRTLFWALLEIAVTAVIFGLCMAAYYARGRRKYRLPLWRELNP